MFNQPTALLEFLKKNRAKNFRILYQPRTSSPIKHWRQVGVIAYACGDMLLCIDEVGMLTEYGNFRQDAPGEEPILSKIVHFGRHRKLNVIATAQRPSQVARGYSALCTEFRIFQTTEPRDLKYLEEFVGSETAAMLPKIEKYDFVVWNDVGVTKHKTKPRETK